MDGAPGVTSGRGSRNSIEGARTASFNGPPGEIAPGARRGRVGSREQMISGATRLAKVRRFVAGSAVQLSFPPPEFRPAKACGNMFMTTPIA